MSLAHGILGFLNYASMSGYDLSKAFSSSVQFFWNAQNSQIYATLSKLEKKKLVTYDLIIQEEKPNKKVYTITPAGKKEFMAWLAQNNDGMAGEFKSAFLMKVFFSGNMPPKKSLVMLKAFVEDCKAYLASMDGISDSIQEYEKAVNPYASLYWKFTVNFGDAYIRMCIDWGQKCIQALEELS